MLLESGIIFFLPDQLPMFQLDQLDNLPIILPEFDQNHGISQQPSNAGMIKSKIFKKNLNFRI